jgi:hypothetical protein
MADAAYDYLLTQKGQQLHGLKGSQSIKSAESFISQSKHQISDPGVRQTQTKEEYISQTQDGFCQDGGLAQQRSKIISTRHSEHRTAHGVDSQTQLRTKGMSVKARGGSFFQGTKGTKYHERQQISYRGQSKFPAEDQEQQQFVKGGQVKYGQESIEQFLQ